MVLVTEGYGADTGACVILSDMTQDEEATVPLSVTELKVHAIRTQIGLTTEKVLDLSPEASAWLGARIWEWLDKPELQGMSESMRWLACREFHGVACSHPDRDYIPWGPGSPAKRQYICKVCGTGVVEFK